MAVVLATHNEATNIERCLKAIQALADEVIVVDGASTDATVQLAKQRGAKVIETTNKPIFHINKQLAIEAAQSDWILQLDADEVVDATLLKAIDQLLSEESPKSAFWIKRKNYFLGAFLTKGGQYPDPVIRLFKKGKAYLPQKSVHEQMVVEGEVSQIDGHLLHYNAPTFKRYLTNANRYTSLTAQELFNQKVKLSWGNDLKYLVIKPLMTGVTLFMRHRGYQDGFRGLVFALFSGLHHALAYMKLGDLYRKAGHARRH